MRYRYTVELTVDELDFSATEAEHLRAALREAAEEYATGEVKVLCEDGWCIEKNDARIRAALLGMRQRGTIYEIKKIPENCSTCLYGRGLGCSNANVKENWLSYIWGLRKCPHYWLDQNRFTPVDGNRW